MVEHLRLALVRDHLSDLRFRRGVLPRGCVILISELRVPEGNGEVSAGDVSIPAGFKENK